MSKLLSLISLPLSILIALKYFGIYDPNTFLPLDVVLIGALFLVAMQVFAYITIHKANEGTSLMGKLIKTILAIPGILYLLNLAIPLNLPFNLEIIIALFLFTEGIYGLH